MTNNSSKKYTLVNQDIDTSVISLETTWRGICDNELEKYTGTKPDSFLEVIRGSTINYYVDVLKINDFIYRCNDLVLNNREFLDLIKQGTVTSSKEMREYALDLFPRIDQIDIREFPSILNKIMSLQEKCAMYGTAFAFCDVLGGVTNELIKIVQKRESLKFSIHDYTTVLGLPEDKSLTESAYEEVRNSDNDSILLNKYFWLDQGYIGRGLNIEKLREIRDIKKVVEEGPDRDELIRDLQLSEEEMNKFIISQTVVAMKSLRIDSRQFLYVVLNKIMDRISSIQTIPSDLLSVMTINELSLVLKNIKNLPNNLIKRFDHSVFVSKGDKYNVLIGDDADKFLFEVTERQKELEVIEIKGQVAQVGNVKGIVKVVFGPQHLKKVMEGDILVSVVTSPQLLPAMKRAGAFITDIGGITSHAAIVARELQKPCIIGTKIATKVLKDGDLVEVNADKGTVTILKRA